jgi:hypothetical protein
MLTPRVKLEIAGILAIVAIGIVGGSWLGAREEGIRLKATMDAQNAVLAGAAKREADRDALLKQSLASIEDAKQATKTPVEALERLPQVLPLPQPIYLTAATPASPGTSRAELPSAPLPQTATIPAADLKPLYDFAADCKECQAKVATLEQDKTDDGVKLDALTKERDAAITAAKGGARWVRVKRAAKWFVIGAAAGAVAAAVAGAAHR